MPRRCFFSFHYKPDCVRVSQVRNIGVIEGNQSATDNDWEAVTRGGEDAINKWIASQMSGRTCTIVLVGAETANRKWINHEIVKSWNDGLGIVGIRIHGLKNFDGKTSVAGENPFDFITLKDSGKKLSSIVRCYDPIGSTSQERYDWISNNLSIAIEEAVKIRNSN